MLPHCVDGSRPPLLSQQGGPACQKPLLPLSRIIHHFVPTLFQLPLTIPINSPNSPAKTLLSRAKPPLGDGNRVAPAHSAYYLRTVARQPLTSPLRSTSRQRRRRAIKKPPYCRHQPRTQPALLLGQKSWIAQLRSHSHASCCCCSATWAGLLAIWKGPTGNQGYNRLLSTAHTARPPRPPQQRLANCWRARPQLHRSGSTLLASLVQPSLQQQRLSSCW